MAGEEKSTAFETEERDDGKTSTLFNREGDGEAHGHVVTSDNGETTNYARDEDGNVYVDDSQDESKDNGEADSNDEK